MTFLAAAFLAGLAALAVPVWLHRTQSHAAAEKTVASLMLLRQVDEPLRARRALTRKALLALRLSLLAALVLAFAQPVLNFAVAPAVNQAPARPRLVVLDASLSMRRAPVWDEAVAAARRLLAGAPAPSRAATAAEALTLAPDAAGLAPGWARLDFGQLAGRLNALVAALPATANGWRVDLISDFQASAMPERFATLGATLLGDAASELVLHPIRGETENWALQSVYLAADRAVAVVASYADRPRALTVALTPRGDGDRNGAIAAAARAVTAVVPAGGRREVSLPLPPATGRDEAWQVALVDAEDALAADDRRVFARAGTAPPPVGVLADDRRGATRFLTAALGASGVNHVMLAQPPWPQRLAALIVVDGGQLPAPEQRRLRRHLDAGGGALIVVGPATERRGALPVTDEPVTPTPVAARRPRIAQLAHPLAADGWDEVTVWRALSMPATPTETLLSLVSGAAETTQPGVVAAAAGEPLLVEKRVGKGRVLVLLTALTRSWSDLVVRPAFVTLIGRVVDYLADVKPMTATVGEPFRAGEVRVLDERGQPVSGLGQARARLSRPGLHTVHSPGKRRLLAVNVDPRESDLRPVSAEYLAAWQAALQPSPAKAAAPPTAQATTPLAPWLLALALLCLAAESIVANIGWRRAPAPTA